MKAKVNKDVCLGCGACTSVCNKVFTIGDDGLAETVGPYIDENKKTVEVADENKDAVIDAAECCPVGAIELSEE